MTDGSKKSTASQSKLLEYEQDPNFCQGESTFEFHNGDKYTGGYCAHRSGVVWREGLGTYTTKDGQVYKGMWKDDKLFEQEQVEISFADDFQYYGKLTDNKFNGPALYCFHQNMNLLCSFSVNKPIGDLLIIDKKGKQWRGVASESTALFLPEQQYSKIIPSNYGKGKTRTTPEKPKKQTMTVEERPEEPTLDAADKERTRKLEMKIFAKTKKTISDLKFEQSDWYQNYENFKKIYTEILDIVNNAGEESLSDSQKEWFRKYGEFKKKYLQIMEARKYKERNLSEYKLFELFNSDEYKNSCPPVRVFYPSEELQNECSGYSKIIKSTSIAPNM